MRPAESFCAHGHHDLSAQSGDDSASRQQKMLQQRELAIRRQRDLAKSSIGATVTAQLNTPVEATAVQNIQNKALGWGRMLQAGIDGSACSSNLMRIIVPAADEDTCPKTAVGLASSPKPTSFEAVVTETGLLTKATVLKSGAGYQKVPAVLQKQSAFQESGADICWETHVETMTQDKVRSRKLWKPWGSSKKENAPTEKIVEEVRVCVMPAADDDVSLEERRAMSINRAATPWEPQCDNSLLEESIGSDLSSIPGFMNADDAQDACHDAQEASLDAPEALPDFMLEQKGVDSIAQDHDDDGDSGIDESVSEWKLQENQSPSQKKSRFNRFISSVQAPKFWRAPKGHINVPTRIEVAPSYSNPDPVIDLD